MTLNSVLLREIKRNNIKNFVYLYKLTYPITNDDMLSEACTEERISIIKIIIDSGHVAIDKIYDEFCNACMNNKLISAKFIYDYVNSNNKSVIAVTYELFYETYKACRVNVIKWMYSLNKNINLKHKKCEFMSMAVCRDNIDLLEWNISLNYCSYNEIYDAFYNACTSDCLKSAIYLYNVLTTNYSQHTIDLEKLFGIICAPGNIEIGKWIYSVKNDIKITNDMFYESCWSGDMKFIEWIYSLNKNINVDKNIKRIDDIFTSLCYARNVDVMKWFYKLIYDDGYKINIYMYSSEIMSELLRSDDLKAKEIVKWLYSLDEDGYKKSIQDGNLFSELYLHLECLQWLYSINNKINIHINYDDVFLRCCRDDRRDTVKWLYSLDEKYYNKILLQNGGNIKKLSNTETKNWIESLHLDNC